MPHTVQCYVKRRSSDADGESQLTFVVSREDYDASSAIGALTGLPLYLTVLTKDEYQGLTKPHKTVVVHG